MAQSAELRMNVLSSWGRFFKYRHNSIMRPNWTDEVTFDLNGPYLAYGKGRSYGDSCLIENGNAIQVDGLNRFIAFDSETGVLKCEAGVTFANIIAHFLPRGFFLPVTPGTKFVTVGGAIANDVHGKNHIASGNFGRFVRSFALLRSSGEILVCSPNENMDLFAATIGGLGLTGLILWAEFTMIPVKGPLIDQEVIQFDGLDDFFELEKQSVGQFAYTVAWIDCMAQGKHLGRGFFGRGNHSNEPAPRGFVIATTPKIRAPIEAPNWALNRWSVKAFNQAVYHVKGRTRKQTVGFDPFFYPLDSVGEWNKVYGSRGFFQYQAAIPEANSDAVRDALKIIVASGQASFLVVFKKFGSLVSPGLMSFPVPGFTISLDFPNRGPSTLRLFAELDAIVRAARGRLYPAKDSNMKGSDFRAAYPNFARFAKLIDPKFSSSFWRRMQE